MLDLKLYYEEICKIIQESGGNVELQEKRLFDLQENKALKLYEIKLERNLYTQSNYLSFLSNILHMQYGTLKESDMQYFDTAFEKGFITQNIRTMFENKIIRELLYTKIANIKQDYQNKMQEDWTQYRTITTRLNEID
ncbi:hypothetical protein IJM86_02680 [bacterium]|nr:hypothetical protein [bacterium]